MKTPKNKPKQVRQQKLKKLNKKLVRRIKHATINGVSNETPNDRLEILKRKYEQDILWHERELAELKSKLRNLAEFAQESEELRNVESASDKYANMGTTDAVLDAVNSLWLAGKATESGVSAVQIRDYMLAHGFKPNTENFDITLNITLKRLVESVRLYSVAGYSKVDKDGLRIASRTFYQPIKKSFDRVLLRAADIMDQKSGRSMRVKRKGIPSKWRPK